VNRRERRRRERYIREIEAAEAKARSPEAVALRARQAQQKVEREAARAAIWRLVEEQHDEKLFLADALRPISGAILKIVSPSFVGDEDAELEACSYAIDLIGDNESAPDAMTSTVNASFVERAVAWTAQWRASQRARYEHDG